MKQFNQQKTVCSVFPFYQLENDDIQNMVTQPTPVQFSKTNSRVEKTKMCNPQDENDKLNLLNKELKDQLRTINEKLVCQNSDFQHKLDEKEKELNEIKFECSNLQSKLHDKQTLRKEIETEYSEFQETTFIAVDKEQENYKGVNKEWRERVNELKNEI